MKRFFSLSCLFTLLCIGMTQPVMATLDIATNLKKPLTIETTTTAAGGRVEFRHVHDISGLNKNSINLDYRMQVNGGEWSEWITVSQEGITTYKELYNNSITLSASTSYVIQFRGTNPNGFGKNASVDYYRIILGSSSTSWNVTLSGNIMSLIVGYDTANEKQAQKTLASANEIPSTSCFFALFNNYVRTGRGEQGEPLRTMYPPRINAENLIFPAIYLKEKCYGQLFYTSSSNTTTYSIGGSSDLIQNYNLGLNEGPCFLAPSFTDKDGSAVNNTFMTAFMQCSSMKSAHFCFTSCPTGSNFNAYTVYATPDDKTLYAPAGFNPISCSIGNWNSSEWTYTPPEPEPDPEPTVIDLYDNRDAAYYDGIKALDGQTYDVVYHRLTAYTDKDGSTRWYTLCLPFDVDYGMLAAAGLLYKVYEFRYAEEVGEQLVFHFRVATSMVAGRGYLVKASNAMPDTYSFYGVTFHTEADAQADINDLKQYGYKSGGEVSIVGTLRQGELKADGKSVLGLYDNKVYYPQADGNTMPAYRAFFYTTNPKNIAPRVRMVFEDE